FMASGGAMTLMSLGLGNVHWLAHEVATDDDIQPTSRAQQQMLGNWERQIAYCRKYREFLSNEDQQFVDELAGRQRTPGRVRHLNAITAAIQRDPRSSRG